MRDSDEVLLSAYHEAAHAVFAYHDDIGVGGVWVSDERGECAILRADFYERYLPWKYAQFCLAGAYAAGIAADLEHPKPEDVPLSWLLSESDRTPKGDAWWAVEALGKVVSAEDAIFGSVSEAYAFALMKLARLVEERWGEIEAVAFALHERWEKNGETVGRLQADEVTQIIDSAREEKEHA